MIGFAPARRAEVGCVAIGCFTHRTRPLEVRFGELTAIRSSRGPRPLEREYQNPIRVTLEGVRAILDHAWSGWSSLGG